MPEIKTNVILVDGHVHIYDCYSLTGLFDSAHRNFSAAASKNGIHRPYTPVLMLTESGTYDRFSQLRAMAEGCAPQAAATSPWNLDSLDEDCALRATGPGGESLLLIAGRQVITAEGLELLALGTLESFTDGTPAAGLLQQVHAAGALPVFPWAAGKWLGKRGKVLGRLLEREAGNGLLLGDNGGRPGCWRYPAHLGKVATGSLRIIPGTDPLPVAGEESRVGSYGCMLQGSIPERRPAAALKALLRDRETPCTTYGQLTGPLRFVYNQLHLRFARTDRA